MNNSYLKLFVDCLEKCQKLSDAEFGRLIRAALHYKANGEEVELNGREELLWNGFKLDIDRDNIKHNYVSGARKDAGKKGAEARWQTDSKNSKSHFDDSKNSNCQQEEDKDKEEDKEIPPKSPKGETKDIFAEGVKGMSDGLLSAVKGWISFKAEKRQPYKPTGLKSLLSEIRNNAVKYGDIGVICAINESMAANYQGIVWDKAKSAQSKSPPGGESSSGYTW